MAEKFNWCFIGAGKLANEVAKKLLSSGRHSITSVYTRRYEKGVAFAKKYGCKACKSAQEAILAEGVDGVYVVTPHNSHYEYAKLSLTLKKPVLVEKPFTVHRQEAEELFALARENKVYIAEAMWTWFSDCAYKVKQCIDSGDIGAVTYAEAAFSLYTLHKNTRIVDPKRAGGALLDLGVYPITYMLRLFGYPDSIVCSGKVRGGVDLYEKVTLTFGDTVAVCRSSIKSPIIHDGLKIIGTTGRIVSTFFHKSGKAKCKTGAGTRRLSGKCSYLHEFDRVVEEIRAGLNFSAYQPPSATLDVLKIMDECMAQMGLKYDL